MSEPFIYTHGISNCCGAAVYDDSDICTDCKEHCEVMTECPDCDGAGYKTVMDMDSVNSRTVSHPNDIIVTCERCNGEGEI